MSDLEDRIIASLQEQVREYSPRSEFVQPLLDPFLTVVNSLTLLALEDCRP